MERNFEEMNNLNPLHILESSHPLLKKFSNRKFLIHRYLKEVVSKSNTSGLEKIYESLKKCNSHMNDEMGSFFFQFYNKIVQIEEKLTFLQQQSLYMKTSLNEYESVINNIEEHINTFQGHSQVSRDSFYYLDSSTLDKFEIDSFINPTIGSKRWFEEFPEKVEILIAENKYEESLEHFKELKNFIRKNESTFYVDVNSSLIYKCEEIYGKLVNALTKEIIMNPNSVFALTSLKDLGMIKRAISAFLNGKSKQLKFKLKKLITTQNHIKRIEELAEIFIQTVQETKKDFLKIFEIQTNPQLTKYQKPLFSYFSRWLNEEIQGFASVLEETLFKNSSFYELRNYTLVLNKKLGIMEKEGLCLMTYIHKLLVESYRCKLKSILNSTINNNNQFFFETLLIKEGSFSEIDLQEIKMKLFEGQLSENVIKEESEEEEKDDYRATTNNATELKKDAIIHLSKGGNQFLHSLFRNSSEFFSYFVKHQDAPIISLHLSENFLEVITTIISEYFGTLPNWEGKDSSMIKNHKDDIDFILSILINLNSYQNAIQFYSDLMEEQIEKTVILSKFVKTYFEQCCLECVKLCENQMENIISIWMTSNLIQWVSSDSLLFFENKQSNDFLKEPPSSFLKIFKYIIEIEKNIQYFTKNEIATYGLLKKLILDFLKIIVHIFLMDSQDMNELDKNLLLEKGFPIQQMGSWGLENAVFGFYFIGYGVIIQKGRKWNKINDPEFQVTIEERSNELIESYLRAHHQSSVNFSHSKEIYFNLIQSSIYKIQF